MFDSAALDHGFGIEVTGLDLAGDVGHGTMAKLKQLFHERQLMVIRGQDIGHCQIKPI